MMYRFILLKDHEEIMGTDVDEPKPQIDAEFWDRFMQGDCDMRFVKSYEDNDDDLMISTVSWINAQNA